MTSLDLLDYAQKIRRIAQAGLAYTKDKYDRERFTILQDLSFEIMADCLELEKVDLAEIFSREIGYPTPKVDVRAAIFKQNKILLVKEKIDQQWALPGGWADAGLSVRENLIKEASEEAGAEIIPLNLIAVQDRDQHNKPPLAFAVYKIFVECKLVEFQFAENIETSTAQFFTVDNLPKLSKSRNTKEQIKLCFEFHHKNKKLAVFD
jgi:ADP-ribose pyrophosphatase YjhB (NUDIX family)